MLRHRLLVSIALLLAASLPTAAADWPVARPAGAGFSTDIGEHIDALVAGGQ